MFNILHNSSAVQDAVVAIALMGLISSWIYERGTRGGTKPGGILGSNPFVSFFIHNFISKFSGLMVSALDSGVSAPGSSPGWGHCVVFLSKTISQYLSPPRCKWVPANLMLGVTLRWTGIPSRGE